MERKICYSVHTEVSSYRAIFARICDEEALIKPTRSCPALRLEEWDRFQRQHDLAGVTTEDALLAESNKVHPDLYTSSLPDLLSVKAGEGAVV